MSEEADVGAGLVVMEDEQMRGKSLEFEKGVVLWENNQQS